VAKFQTDRFCTFRENRAEKKIKKSRRVNHIRSAAATLRSAVAGGVNKTAGAVLNEEIDKTCFIAVVYTSFLLKQQQH